MLMLSLESNALVDAAETPIERSLSELSSISLSDAFGESRLMLEIILGGSRNDPSCCEPT